MRGDLMRLGRLLLLLVTLAGVAGCATGGKGKAEMKLPSFPFLNSYAAAKKDYEQGRIMEARQRVLKMDKSRDDYAQAKKLLDKKIEPARIRLLKLYSGRAASAERNGEWSKAMELYDQAAAFSLDPKSQNAKRDAMEIKMRQDRFDRLINFRRQEDAQWLAGVDAFEPPKGVDSKDPVFVDMREQLAEGLEARAREAYNEASRYLRKGPPEIAYIEIESHLRLDPDSERGQQLKKEILAAMPKGIVIPPENSTQQKHEKTRVSIISEKVTEEKVRALMKNGDWVTAKKYATVYRREGGDNADRLLRQINSQLAADAAREYAKGRMAFRQEQLDAAITHWTRAVSMMPGNSEYALALRRARQLKERLKLIQESAGENP